MTNPCALPVITVA